MKTWTTKDGQKIPIRDLADRHLLNIHRMLRQKIEDTKLYLGVLGTMWEPRGDGACAAFDQEMEQQLDQDIVARVKLKTIQVEVNRRQLTELPLKKPYKPMPEMELVEDLGVGRIYKVKRR